jgi:hypothetical protein
MGRVYKTLQGKEIDMDKLTLKNESIPAVGNVRMNARGDELGPGGKIVKTREQILAEYYDKNPRAIKEELVDRKDKK